MSFEARRDPRRGLEVSVIIRDGILRRGDEFNTPTASGKIKILENFLGKPEDELLPCAPALIIGFESIPKVGEIFEVGAEREASGTGRRENIFHKRPNVPVIRST